MSGVSGVRPRLGRGLGSPQGENILTLSSGVFFSAFLSPSGFPGMGNTDKLSLVSGVQPSIPYLSVPGPLTSKPGMLFGPPSPVPQLSPDPRPSLWMEVGVTHHPGVCLPVVWQTLAPLPSWLLETGEGTRVRKMLSGKPMLALALKSGQRTRE